MTSWQPDESIDKTWRALERSRATLSDADRLLDRLFRVRAFLSNMASSTPASSAEPSAPRDQNRWG